MKKQEANTSRAGEFQRQRTESFLEDLLTRIRCVSTNTSPQEDAEAVHQLRVGIRRAQAALVIEQQEEPRYIGLREMSGELKRIMTLAGEVRNRDITLAFLAQQMGTNPECVDELQCAREKWRRKLAKSLRSSLENGWCAQLAIPGTAVAAHLPEDKEGSEFLRRAIKTLRKATRSYFRRGREAARELRPSAAWHRFRLAAKRLRDGLDFFQPAWDLGAYSRHVRAAQHHLGVINDAGTILKLIAGLAMPKGDVREFKAILREQVRPHLKNIRLMRKSLTRDKQREWEREIEKTLTTGPASSDDGPRRDGEHAAETHFN